MRNRERKAFALTAVWLVTAGALGAARADAADQGDREIARTYTAFYLERHDFNSAIGVLKDHLRTDLEDAGAWNLLGLALLGRENYEEASRAFAEAARRAGSGEDRPLYLYNQADALVRGGDLKRSRDVLEGLVHDPRIGGSAEDALKTLERRRPLPPVFVEQPGRWRLSASLGSGYDTNVTLASDVTRSTQQSTGAGSAYVNPSAELRYSRLRRGGEFEASARSSFNWLASEAARPYNSLNNGLTLGWDANPSPTSKLVNSYASDTSLNYINSDSLSFYNWSQTFSWKPAFRHSEIHQTELNLPVGYQNFADDASTDAADRRDGLFFKPQLTYRRFGQLASWSVGARYEQVLASGDNYKARTVAVPLTYTRNRLPWEMIGSARLELSRTQYPKSSSDRSDKAGKLSLTLMKQTGKSSFGVLTYSFDRNLSTLGSAQYNKHTVGVSLVYELF